MIQYENHGCIADWVNREIYGNISCDGGDYRQGTILWDISVLNYWCIRKTMHVVYETSICDWETLNPGANFLQNDLL